MCPPLQAAIRLWEKEPKVGIASAVSASPARRGRRVGGVQMPRLTFGHDVRQLLLGELAVPALGLQAERQVLALAVGAEARGVAAPALRLDGLVSECA